MKAVGNKDRSSESEYVVLEGVPWVTCEGILDAIGEYHLRHTYDEGALQMRRILYGVAWEDYLKLLDAKQVEMILIKSPIPSPQPPIPGAP